MSERMQLAIDAQWLQAVESETAEHRYDLAEQHDRIADAADSEGRYSSGAWHRGRARGQRERFQRIERCQAGVVAFCCKHCGEVHASEPDRCAAFRVCAHCRGKRASRLRSRFAEARLDAVRHRSRFIARPIAGGRWSEKFLTLTFPATGDPAADVRDIYAAWPRFIRALRRYWIVRRDVPAPVARSIDFCRVLEVTPGNEGGHAHLHVWLLCPWVSHVMLRTLWARALSAEARERLPMRSAVELLSAAPNERVAADILDALRSRASRRPLRTPPQAELEQRWLYWPVVDIRRCQRGVESELVKYLVKDIDRGERLDPATFGRIYCALEARRTVIARVHFWRPRDQKTCCGSPLVRVRVRVVESSDGTRGNQHHRPRRALGPPASGVRPLLC